MSGGSKLISALGALKDFGSFTRTAGDLTLNSTSWANLPTIGTTWDVALSAAVGDTIECDLSAVADSAGINTFFDVVTVVSGSVVNSISTGATPSDSNDGVSSWFMASGSAQRAAGSIQYVLQAGDISSSGVATLRLRYREDGATNRNLHATALFPLQFSAKNLGRPGGISVLSGTPSPDDVPASPNAADYEFNATSSSLPTGWSWFNQGTSTYSEAKGAGVLLAQTGSGVNRGIVQSLPAGSSWTVTAKVTATGGSQGANGWGVAGICLRSSGDTKLSVFGYQDDGKVAGYRYTGDTYSADILTPITPAGQVFNGGYLRIVRNSSTSYDLAYSRDGVTWSTVVSAHNPTGFHTPDQVGFFLRLGAAQLAAHWFRVT